MKELLLGYKESAIKRIEEIRSDKNLVGRIYLITLAAALLILAVTARGPEQKGRVVNDSDGNAVYIERNSMNFSESYDFEIAVKRAGEVIKKEISLNLQAIREGIEDDILSEGADEAAALDAAIENAVNEIEYSKSEKINLPEQLGDGSEISWRALDKKDYSIYILIPGVYIGLLIFVIRYSGEKDRESEAARRRSILRGLPRFCNQLFLMMNAGMILSDAFDYIASGYAAKYEGTEDNEGDYFERELSSMREKDPERRKSSASIINEFAVKNDVKEMIRIATILTENEKRGSDVIESLSRESRYLWDERKIVARENGKMIDTKMSYPLGILLILLIVITMAPAMLSM